MDLFNKIEIYVSKYKFPLRKFETKRGVSCKLRQNK